MNSSHPPLPSSEPAIDGDPFGNLWITSKCHKAAEARNRRRDLLSHMGLVYYSIFLIYFSLYFGNDGIETQKLSGADLNIIMSFSIVVLSTIAWAMKFGEAASKHRDCYLEIDAIDRSDVEAAQSKYREILKNFQNFSSYDYEGVVFEAWLTGKQLVNRSRPEPTGSIRLLRFVFAAAIRLIGILFAFIAPICIGWLAYAY